MGETDWKEKESHTSMIYSGDGKLSRLGWMMPMTRNCLKTFIPDKDFLLTHSGTTSSDLDSTGNQGKLPEIPFPWTEISASVRGGKDGQGAREMTEDRLCTHTVRRWGAAYPHTSGSHGTILLGGSSRFSDMTCNWEEYTCNSPLNHHNSEEVIIVSILQMRKIRVHQS